MYQAPSNPRDEELVGDQQLDDAVKFFLATLEHVIKFLGLRNGARETIQYESARLKICEQGVSAGTFILRGIETGKSGSS